MNKLYKGLIAFFLLALLLIPASPALAMGPLDGGVVFGEDFTLEAGDTLDGDLVVFGGDVTIEEGASVNGSLAVFGGDTTLAEDAVISGDVALIGGDMQTDGTIDGDIVVLGGELSLGETALVEGDVTKIGGDLEQAPGATINGEIIEEDSPSISLPSVPAVPVIPAQPGISNPGPEIQIDVNPWGQFAAVFANALGLGVVAMATALFLQPQLERAGQAIRGEPLVAGAFGMLLAVLGPIALVLVTLITFLLLSPLALVGALALFLACLFGLIALGLDVGERLGAAFHQQWSPPVMAGIGSFVLALAIGYLSYLPCVGTLASVLVVLLGLGGTALTIFGSRAYPRLAPPAAPALTETA